MDPNNTTQGQKATEVSPAEISAGPKNNANLVIVVVLAVIVVVLALMYLWGSTKTELPPAPEPVTDVLPVATDDVETLAQELALPEIDTLGTELDALEADLEAELQAL